MKVVAINGSPKADGNTYHALKIITEELENQGISTEIIQIGAKNIRGCTACLSCFKNKNEKCIINDEVNEVIQKMKEADGIIISSPVYYASIAGTMKSFLDRAFYVASANGGLFRHKVGASVAVARRSGEVAVFDHLNHYLTVSEMFIASSNYWNVIHGKEPGEVLKDEEGAQTMRVLAKNIAFLIKLLNNNNYTSLPLPEKEVKIRTNFIQ
jgi:multimeric flavodoxin WrbA